MRHWLKDPLLHFLVIGGLLFIAYAWLDRVPAHEPRVLRVTPEEVKWLKETWVRQWQRSPNEEELRALLTDYLQEELLAREARELGLDENDTIVRRRLAQKMEFLVQDTARLAEPDEDELVNFYAANHTTYQTPARISFHQIYFKNEASAHHGLEELRTSGIVERGDPILLEDEYIRTDEQTVTNLFGPKFSHSLFTVKSGLWEGPIQSGYGFHLVRISEHLAAQPRPLEDVRTQVRHDWHRSQQAKVKEQLFAELWKKYDVIVDESVKSLMEPLGKIELAER